MSDKEPPTPTPTTSSSSGGYDSSVWETVKRVFPKRTGESSTHRGNCHCGAVRFRFTLSPPLHAYPVINCNCSACARDGALLVYPDRADFALERPTPERADADGSFEKDGDVLAGYVFGDEKVRHRFCRRCGSSVFLTLVPGRWERFVERGEDEEGGAGVRELVPVNVRMITGLDLDALKLNKVDGWKMLTPQYELKD